MKNINIEDLKNRIEKAFELNLPIQFTCPHLGETRLFIQVPYICKTYIFHNETKETAKNYAVS